MTSKLESVLNEALTLNTSQRAMLARSLISSIDAAPEEGVEAAWMDLARKRLAELDSGEVKPVSWESIKDQVRASRRSHGIPSGHSGRGFGGFSLV